MKSLKAKAWAQAAQILEEEIARGGGNPEIIAHILDHVVPSLRQRARIIERNHKTRS
jgi:hypothetical protein